MQQIQFIGTTPNSLIDLIDDALEKRLEDLKKNFQPKEPPKLYSRQQLADFFDVDISTIHNWTKRGILTANQIGGRVYYKREDVESAMVELKK